MSLQIYLFLFSFIVLSSSAATIPNQPQNNTSLNRTTSTGNPVPKSNIGARTLATEAKSNALPANTSGDTQIPLSIRLDEATIAKLKTNSEPWWKTIQPLLSTLIGAVIALVGSYFATTRAHTLQVARKERENKEFVDQLKAAIKTELELLGNFYEMGIGKDLSKARPTDPLRTRFALTEQWFTIFQSNANHIGKFDEETSKSLIKVYGLMKSMIEYFRINNMLLDELEKVEKYLAGVLDDDDARGRRKFILEQMGRITSMLKDIENVLKKEVVQLQRLSANSATSTKPTPA